MSTRVFDNDYVTSVQGVVTGETNATVTPDTGLLIHASGTISGSFQDATTLGENQQYGVIDWLRFPSIPSTAILNSMRLRATLTGAAQATIISITPPSINSTRGASIGGSLKVDFPIGMGNLSTTVFFDFSNEDGGSGVGTSTAAGGAYDSGFIDISAFNLTFDDLVGVARIYSSFFGSGAYAIVFDPSVADGNADFTAALISWTLEIDYTETFTWDATIENPDPIDAGDPITVTSSEDDEHPIDFEQILTVTVIQADGTEIDVPIGNWTTVEEFLFIFTLPAFVGSPTVISIVITSTQFSGSVTLGQLITIFFTSASGIYRLVTDKRNDTLYIEEDLPNTVDVKIPNPFIKTAFLGD